MHYPYEIIYGCLQLAGMEETPKRLENAQLVYADPPTPEEKMEYYHTDGNCFSLYSPNLGDYTPFCPHICYDHLFLLLQSWKLNGRLIKCEGHDEKNIQKEVFGTTMISCVDSIMDSVPLKQFRKDLLWEKTVETKKMLETFMQNAEAYDRTQINLFINRDNNH